MSMKKKNRLCIINIVGARPNFMKIAPLMAEYVKYPEIQAILVHTGQHYDEQMSKLFFEQLEIPRPDINLEVGSASHALQTAEIMKRFETVVLEKEPDIVLVVGDVNSTLACALVAAKMGIKVAHVEAGLRSFDRQMPEEINRIVTDALSDYLFVTEPSGVSNLKKEGISDDKVFLVGNIMIDTLVYNLKKAEQSPILRDLGLQPQHYAVITLHRPSNVDDPEILGRYMKILRDIGRQLPVIFPTHPRTRSNLEKYQLLNQVNKLNRRTRVALDKGVYITNPLSYLDFLQLMAKARFVLTDSGGIQEETTYLGVPCLTLRNNTERPVTVDLGTNILVGTEPEVIPAALQHIMNREHIISKIPELWDGHTAERIVKILVTS